MISRTTERIYNLPALPNGSSQRRTFGISTFTLVLGMATERFDTLTGLKNLMSMSFYMLVNSHRSLTHLNKPCQTSNQVRCARYKASNTCLSITKLYLQNYRVRFLTCHWLLGSTTQDRSTQNV